MGRYKVIPQDLVACISTNRLWHQTLTPLLWMVFSDYGAKKLGVPQSIIESNSHIFRYDKLHSDFPISDLHSTRLRELDLVIIDPEDITVIVDLLAKNPSLESLQVEFRCGNGEAAALDLLDGLYQQTKLGHTFLAHAAWLETVHIYCKEATEDSFRKAGQIMSECSNLTSFVFAPEKKHLRSENCLALLEQLWKCLNLEELELCRFNHPPDPRMYERLSEEGWILNDYKGRTLIDVDKESFILEKISHERSLS
ncbi:hypothetical protein BGZ82_004984 [Podila clonocystis]|nr:hypothetical protein BGZ82_004984 [Podila clonocystis]